MKIKTNPVILCLWLTMLFTGFQQASANLPERSETEVKDVATELYERMNKNKPELADAIASYESGAYLDFLKKIRNTIMDHMYEKPSEPFPWHNMGTVSVWATEFSDVMVGRTTPEAVKERYPNWTINEAMLTWGIIGDPAVPIQPDFMTVADTRKNGLLRFAEFHSLAGAYWLTGDAAYLRKWEQIWEAYADLFFQQGRDLAEHSDPPFDFRQVDFNHASVLGANWRMESLLKQMAVIIKSLPGTVEKETNWMNAFREMEGKLLPESYDMIDPVSLCKMILCLERDHFGFAFQFYIAQSHTKVPNQTFGGLTGMANIIRTADFFTSIDKMRDDLDKAILEFFEDDVHQDGAIMEQSLNYNLLTLEESRIIQYYVRESKNRSPFLDKIDSILANADKLLDSIATPFGRYPNLGGGWGIHPYRYWEDASLVEKDFRSYKQAYHRNFPIPYEFKHFTSIAFPYGGYYVMRSGWDMDDTYLFTQNARRSLGHLYVSNNEIQLIAKRRDLIMSGGMVPYGEVDLPEDVRDEARSWIAYFGEDANMSRSTLAVDGLPQARGTPIHVDFLPRLSEVKGGVAARVGDLPPIASKWSDSDVFTYHEGLYDQGFIASVDVSHYREIIMIKPLDVVLVSDGVGMPKDASHTLSQIWCFPPYLDKTNSDIIVPGFREKEVVYDPESRLLKTQDPTGPNVFLRSFSNYDVDFRKYYGHKDPDGYYLGWYSHSIQGYKWPKVDVHVNYQATMDTTPLVTVISSAYDLQETVTAHEDLSTDSYSGFRAVAEEKTISYLSARAPVEMRAEGIALTARTLVTVRDGDQINGIAIDGSSLSYRGSEMDPGVSSFEFEIKNGTFRRVQPIEKPSTFLWLEHEDGNKPVYHF